MDCNGAEHLAGYPTIWGNCRVDDPGLELGHGIITPRLQQCSGSLVQPQETLSVRPKSDLGEAREARSVEIFNSFQKRQFRVAGSEGSVAFWIRSIPISQEG